MDLTNVSPLVVGWLIIDRHAALVSWDKVGIGGISCFVVYTLTLGREGVRFMADQDLGYMSASQHGIKTTFTHMYSFVMSALYN